MPPSAPIPLDSETEAVVVLPPSWRAGEGAYCSAVTASGDWVRLDPLSVNRLELSGRLQRWSRIGLRWKSGEPSRTVDPASLRLIGEMPADERYAFLSSLEVADLAADKVKHCGMALVRPDRPNFAVERKTDAELEGETAAYDRLLAQAGGASLRASKPRAFRFKYHYNVNDAPLETRSDGSEINTVFARLSDSLGDAAALAWVIKTFGKEYPEKGIVFALAADETDPTAWHLHGVICMDEVIRESGQQFNVVA